MNLLQNQQLQYTLIHLYQDHLIRHMHHRSLQWLTIREPYLFSNIYSGNQLPPDTHRDADAARDGDDENESGGIDAEHVFS